jgi:para-aminobenzoate synthetase component 1
VSRKLHLDEVPYSPDCCELFDRLRDLPGSALLDSSFPHSTAGRYDIITAEPTAAAGVPAPPGPGEDDLRRWFDELTRFLDERYGSVRPASPDLPFCGGLLGYLDYECGTPLQHLPASRGHANPRAPTEGLRAYEWCVVQDHLLKRAVLIAQPGVAAGRRADLLQRLRQPAAGASPGFRLLQPFRSNLDQEDYRRAFERIQAYIDAGDCYQVNLAQRFSAACEGDPWSAYRELRAVAAAPFAGYVSRPDGGAVLSLSPERFLSLQGLHVETAPIKGTRPRYRDRKADLLAVRELRNSEKDRAENLMIVDLLRNDLGRSCVPGSIHVDRLFEVHSYPTVHHLVSTISGKLRHDRSALDLLRDAFPGGSITGAPKRRAMEIIAELEPHPREVYCGSLLYLSAGGRMDSSIAIRTLLCRDGEIHCWGGGGIVADSRWEQEYQETLDKVGRFLRLLEQLQPATTGPARWPPQRPA